MPEKRTRNLLLLYLLGTAIGFSYLVAPERSSLGFFVFAVLQCLFIVYLMPQKKTLWFIVPILLLSLSTLLNTNRMWFLPNFFVIALLLGALGLLYEGRLSLREDSLLFLKRTFTALFTPFSSFHLPFLWCVEGQKKSFALVGRVLKALLVTVPAILFLVVMLSLADDVFSFKMSSVLDAFLSLFNFNVFWKILLGVLAGFYLFGMLAKSFLQKEEKTAPFSPPKKKPGDLLLFGILLCSVLAVYLLFVVIQFQYLFAKGALPNGLTYSEYARHGFFELLFLSGLNLLLILFTVSKTKNAPPKKGILMKVLLSALCAVTVLLLVSSFYRMLLYGENNGLTRLRLLVFIFLGFETAGLLATFVYIIKPRFNIKALYAALVLLFYLTVNLVPIDTVIAKNQLDRYRKDGSGDLYYVMSLSYDVVGPVAELLEDAKTPPETKTAVREYLKDASFQIHKIPSRWQRWNLGNHKAEKIFRTYQID